MSEVLTMIVPVLGKQPFIMNNLTALFKEAIEIGIKDIVFVTDIEGIADTVLLNWVNHKQLNIHCIYDSSIKHIGETVLCCKDYIKDEAFALILDNELQIKTLINQHLETGASIIGVQSVHNAKSKEYGVIQPSSHFSSLYGIKEISNIGYVEKETTLIMTGQYILSPDIMRYIKKSLDRASASELFYQAVRLLNDYQRVFAFEATVLQKEVLI
ncbi:sugar phosphate nucleotidyltransferase [Fictibacillus aquaticus]|uniref:UTP--glucose-1-phosphate uridylyltransferase n=1 Tax=Fictibacillus aquaticus TaxID=2021314 RepID=A0A235F8R7_9BACL|nr:sugar phosphate nucleotidyltransferase [Fictibacillus aquaticus]OYD57599.1 hypothetical protein CGZ90_13100 [Fictibacillus aquaticus]